MFTMCYMKLYSMVYITEYSKTISSCKISAYVSNENMPKISSEPLTTGDFLKDFKSLHKLS